MRNRSTIAFGVNSTRLDEFSLSKMADVSKSIKSFLLWLEECYFDKNENKCIRSSNLSSKLPLVKTHLSKMQLRNIQPIMQLCVTFIDMYAGFSLNIFKKWLIILVLVKGEK